MTQKEKEERALAKSRETRESMQADKHRRAATIEAAARELLDALPRCDKCSTIATREYFDYDLPRLRCEAHATKVYGETPWAEVALKLAAALEGR